MWPRQRQECPSTGKSSSQSSISDLQGRCRVGIPKEILKYVQGGVEQRAEIGFLTSWQDLENISKMNKSGVRIQLMNERPVVPNR